jgi:hypothetical protein
VEEGDTELEPPERGSGSRLDAETPRILGEIMEYLPGIEPNSRAFCKHTIRLLYYVFDSSEWNLWSERYIEGYFTIGFFYEPGAPDYKIRKLRSGLRLNTYRSGEEDALAPDPKEVAYARLAKALDAVADRVGAASRPNIPLAGKAPPRR